MPRALVRSFPVMIVILALAACESDPVQVDPTGVSPTLNRGHAGGTEVRIEICHRLGPRGYEILEVPERAVASHRGHGDGLPGEEVPEIPGAVFGPECQILDDGAPPEDPDEPDEGAITGTVMDLEGVPLPEIRVLAVDEGSGAVLVEARSDEHGTYALPDPGQVARLMFLADLVEGFFPYVAVCYPSTGWDASCSLGEDVAPGSTGIDQMLIPATVEGQVRAQDTNEGIEGVRVIAYDQDTGEELNSTLTGPDGLYRLVGWESDPERTNREVRVGFVAEPLSGPGGFLPYVATCWQTSDFQVGCANRALLAPWSIDVSPTLIPATVEGQVRAQDTNEGIEGVRVIAYDQDTGEELNSTLTGPDGLYRLVGWESDPERTNREVHVGFVAEPLSGSGGFLPYVATCWQTSDFEVGCAGRALLAPWSIDVSPTLIPARITGQVTTSAGDPLEGANVQVFDRESGELLRTVESGSDGWYEVAGWATEAERTNRTVRVGFVMSGYLSQCYDNRPYDATCSQGAELSPWEENVSAVLEPEP